VAVSTSMSNVGDALILVEHVIKQRLGRFCIARVGSGNLGGRDDLRIGIDRDMALVSVESASGRLVAVPCLRVDRRDDSVAGNPLGDAQPSLVIFQVLTKDRCQ